MTTNLGKVPPPTTANSIRLIAYLFPLLMSILYLNGIATAGKITEAATEFWANIWMFGLMFGAVLCLFGLLAQLKSWPGGLVWEAIGALVLTMEFTAYITALALDDKTRPVYTIVSTAFFALCYGARCVQAMKERGRGVKIQAATEVIFRAIS